MFQSLRAGPQYQCFGVVEVVDVVEVVVVVVVIGRVVAVGGWLIGVAVVAGGAVVGGGGATVVVGMVDLGGSLGVVVDELKELGILAAGDMMVVTGVASGAEVVGVGSLETGVEIVGGGTGAWSVTGGEVTWRTCWFRLGDDDSTPVTIRATVAMTTIVPTPAATPTRGSPNAREKTERKARDRDSRCRNASSIAGGPPSSPCRGGAATSSARNTKEGFVVPLSAVGGADPPSVMAAGDAMTAGIDGLVWSSSSMPAGAGEPVRCSESIRRTSIACSCPSTDRRSPRCDDQVSWDSRMATTNRPTTRKKMPIPRPLSLSQSPRPRQDLAPRPTEHH
ncbi:MAG TPA: hypothetical protein VF005_04200 [Acidimicrobiales bacterium]